MKSGMIKNYQISFNKYVLAVKYTSQDNNIVMANRTLLGTGCFIFLKG